MVQFVQLAAFWKVKAEIVCILIVTLQQLICVHHFAARICSTEFNVLSNFDVRGLQEENMRINTRVNQVRTPQVYPR